MRIGVLGINHKLADLKLREQLAKACQKHFGLLQAIHERHTFILLSTCNRTEVYFCSDDLAETHIYLLSILRVEVNEEFDQKLYSYFGTDCFNHLTRVTLGLDSAIIAETEIQGQVKIAYEATSDYHTLPSDLHFLFQKALGTAKKLRTELQLGRGMPNLEHAILQIGKNVFKFPEKSRILFVGASEINEKILHYLKNKQFIDISLCNRSEEQAKKMTRENNIHYLKWSDLCLWHEYDWIIFGTKSPDYLVSNEEINLKQKNEKKLILDLCVPRNVDPKISLNPKVTLFNIDQINQLLKMRSRSIKHLLKEAEKRVGDATQEHAARYIARKQAKTNYLMVN